MTAMTENQRIYLECLIRKGGSIATGHDRRIFDALVRKGLATATPTPGFPNATDYYPTQAGRDALRPGR